MQNQYVGDIGDFGKFFLLRNIIPNGYKLGVNWYLVANEKHRAEKDGKYIDYLKNENSELKKTDVDLFEGLKNVLKNGREVLNLEKQKLVYNTTYFNSLVEIKNKRVEWFNDSLKSLEKVEIIFCDPDNGIEIKSCKQSNPRAVKFILKAEILNYYKSGKSLIIYQHATRQGDLQTQKNNRVSELIQLLGIEKELIDVVYFGKGTGRFYFIIQQKKHSKEIKNRIESFLIKSNNPFSEKMKK